MQDLCSTAPAVRVSGSGMLSPMTDRDPPERKRHFSMLREFHLADWFTLGNAFCGTGAIFAAMRFLQDGRVDDLLWGLALIPLAFVLDAFYGRVARWRKVSSTRSDEHTSELHSLIRSLYAVFCLKHKTTAQTQDQHDIYLTHTTSRPSH